MMEQVMADYFEMYHVLFLEMTKANALMTQAIEVLQKAQKKTELIYELSDEDILTLVPQDGDSEK